MSADERATTNRQMWSDPSTVAFWRFWQYGWDAFVRAATDLLLRDAGIAPGMRVLDLGSGHGEPALSLADAVGSSGSVAATDLSAPMLELAEEQAAIAGLSNISFTVADAANLPFPDRTFDAAVSRFSMMYLVAATVASREVRRVVRPGGQFACAVWGAAADVPWHAGPIRVLSGYLDIAPIDPDALGPFRFGAPGSLATILTDGGFTSVREVHHTVMLNWPDGLASFVTFVESLHCGLIAQIPATQHERVRDELRAAFRASDGSDAVHLPASIIVASGTVPPVG